MPSFLCTLFFILYSLFFILLVRCVGRPDAEAYKLEREREKDHRIASYLLTFFLFFLFPLIFSPELRCNVRFSFAILYYVYAVAFTARGIFIALLNTLYIRREKCVLMMGTAVTVTVTKLGP